MSPVMRWSLRGVNTVKSVPHLSDETLRDPTEPVSHWPETRFPVQRQTRAHVRGVSWFIFFCLVDRYPWSTKWNSEVVYAAEPDAWGVKPDLIRILHLRGALEHRRTKTLGWLHPLLSCGRSRIRSDSAYVGGAGCGTTPLPDSCQVTSGEVPNPLQSCISTPPRRKELKHVWLYPLEFGFNCP